MSRNDPPRTFRCDRVSHLKNQKFVSIKPAGGNAEMTKDRVQIKLTAILAADVVI